MSATKPDGEHSARTAASCSASGSPAAAGLRRDGAGHGGLRHRQSRRLRRLGRQGHDRALHPQHLRGRPHRAGQSAPDDARRDAVGEPHCSTLNLPDHRTDACGVECGAEVPRPGTPMLSPGASIRIRLTAPVTRSRCSGVMPAALFLVWRWGSDDQGRGASAREATPPALAGPRSGGVSIYRLEARRRAPEPRLECRPVDSVARSSTALIPSRTTTTVSGAGGPPEPPIS